MTDEKRILEDLRELKAYRESQSEDIKQVRRLLAKVLRKLQAQAANMPGFDESKGTFERVAEFLRSRNNEPQTAAAIMAGTGIPRGTLSQLLYRSHRDRFVSGTAAGYSRKKVWMLSEVAGAGAEGAETERAPATHETLFGVEGDLSDLDAAECCYRILRDHRNKPLSVLTMTREALQRGYRARTKGTEDEVLFSTAKSFWARIGRDQRFRKVKPFVYVLARWPP